MSNSSSQKTNGARSAHLVLSHVFVANMTGNVVFLGFALAGASGFSIPASIAALASFGLGAGIAGRVGSRLEHLEPHPEHLHNDRSGLGRSLCRASPL